MNLQSLFSFLLIIALFSACQSEPQAKDPKSEIEALAQEVAQSPSADNQQALITAYMNYALANPAAPESTTYVAEAAKVQATIIAAGQGSSAQFNAKVMEMGQLIFNDSLQQIDLNMASQFVNACEQYAIALPNDEQSPTLLHKGGETARSIRNFDKALALYEKIEKDYPNNPKAPQALFLRAFTLDNDLKRYDEARVLYESFVEKYPEDDFADDTQFLLQNLGKSDEEIIESFNSNSK